MPGKSSDHPPATISSSGMQPRFVRSTTYGATASADKARFSRSRAYSAAASAWPAVRAPRCLHSLLAVLRLRRSKRATAAVTVAALVVALLVFALALRMLHPRGLGRLQVGVEEVTTGVLDLTSQYAGLSRKHGGVVEIGAGNVRMGNETGVVLEGPEGDDDADGKPVSALAASRLPVDTADGVTEKRPVPSEVGTLAMDEERKKYTAEKMSVIVLFHNEYDSLKYALNSWIEKGLIDYADEVLFFLNGVRSAAEFKQKIPDYTDRIPVEKRSLHVSPENMRLGLAITKMIELTKYDYVLLMEKDWELIEERPVMQSRLDDSKVIVGSGVADLVRHRHRYNPGVPLHALIMHEGRERSILTQQKNLLCFVHHWQKDPTVMYPGQGIMYRCGGAERKVEEVDIYCSSSVYCQWTNNPGVFKKKWFMEEVGERYKKEYQIEFNKHGKTSPFLDFEYYTNWRSYAWTDKNFTVAVGTGLFRHAETEHRHFNTFWYAHYRLTQDMVEIRDSYLKNETSFKAQGGVHYDPASPSPPPMMVRYPVDFVRRYHYKDMFTGDLDGQRKLINEIYQPYLDNYRILTEEEWAKTGPNSAKAKKAVDWRIEVTGLHHKAEKAMMLAPPEQPHEMSITLITSLLDLGRDGLAADGYQFRREFKMYLDSMQQWLKHVYPKVVYTSKQIADEMLKTMSEESKKTTKFVITSRAELRTKWLGPDNYDRVQKLRTSKEWLERASWLANSPQAGLDDYNPLVMSKLFMVRDAARNNYFNTSHFVFLDAKHNCMNPKIMTPKNDHILRAHMFNKFLLTTFDYTPASEVHGFEYKAFNHYCNIKEAEKRQLVRVGRGGIFGGPAYVIEYIAAMYDVLLTATLREGLMGTEENILSIVKYQVSHYVDEFSNNWACPDKVQGDHSCPKLKSQGYNCAIFDWVARNATRD